LSAGSAEAKIAVQPRPPANLARGLALPQLVIPELLYHALIAALSMAASYHFFTLVIEWWKGRGTKRP
jgi:hypothetical protein